MEIGEEEIKRAKLTKAQGSAAFKALCPSGPLRGKTLELYRAHAREMGDRVRVKPTEQRAEAIVVVTEVRDGWKRGAGPRIEIQVEFRGSEWFYPYRAWFQAHELEALGHGSVP